MLQTRLTTLLGCKYPIVQTAMGWVADPRLVAGSCNAGGFGFLAGATIPPEEMERDILQVKALTDKPFGVNFHMYQPNAADIVDMVIQHGVKAVSYSRSPGPEFIQKLKSAGVICMPTVGLPKHAIKAVELGADVVTVQGGEGGGHTGTVPTTLLIPQVIDVVVESSKLIKLDPYNALDRDSLDYQLQNLKALKSIDPKERMKAVKRLADSEPKARRRDIAEALIQMLPESKTDLQLEIIKTLKKWSKPGEGAEPVVLAAVKQIHQQGKVDKTSMEFLVDRGVEGSEVILIELWDKAPVTWSDIVMRLGEGAQILLLPKIKEMDVAHLAAVSAILGKTGTAACIPHLEQEMASKDEHGKKSLQAAIDEIKKRQ